MSTAEKQVSLSQELEVLKPEIGKVLPAHVTADKFMRVVMTAIAQSPDLRNADRRSLLTACVRAATDGLVPDGREAALVIFKTKDGKKVQYMPMVAGILKKVRNSGELLSIVANVVFEKDKFRYFVDDVGEHVLHEPNVLDAERGKLIAVYAIAKTKDGGVFVEVMSRSQIEQVRDVSRAKDNGPWVSWYDEMARKTVIRRLSKRLPMSTDLETVIQRDDELYDLGKRRNETGLEAGGGVAGAKAALGIPMLPDDDLAGEASDQLGDGGEAAATADGVDKSTGEIQGKYTETDALKLLESKRTSKTLTEAYDEICDDYRDTGREISDAIGVKYQEMLESLKEREKV